MTVRPIHEILEACKPYLYSPTNPNGRVRICYALEEAADPDEGIPVITGEECDTAQDAVIAAVRRLAAEYAYLRGAAAECGLVQWKWTVTSPEYIAFRDKWLNNLIEELRNAETVPQPAAQQDQPEQ